MKKVLGCAAFVFVAHAALADTETVHLADGSVFSGDLVEKVPGDHVTLKLATGEVRRFAWSVLAPTLAVATSPTTTTAPVTVVQPQLPQLPPLQPRPAHVDLRSDTRGALLVRVDSIPVGLQGWTQSRESPVCYAPCTADVDANATYYVTGYNITQSSRFAIPEGNTALSVHTGASGLTATGAMLITLGSLALVTGAIATPIAFADAKTPPLNGWETFGLSALVGGAVFVLVGIPFVVAGRTRVSVGDMDVARRRWLPNGFRF